MSPLAHGTGGSELAGRGYRLRPIYPPDYDLLYRWSTEPPSSLTWRFRGVTPSPESFTSLLWSSVLAQFVIVAKHGGEVPVGLIQAFNHDTAGRVIYVGVLVAPEAQKSFTAAAEGLAIFLSYLFENFDIRKVYAEVSTEVPGLSRIVAGWNCVREEGRLTKHLFHDGAFHDLLILAVDRDAFLGERPRITRLLYPEPRSAGTQTVSFDSFVGRLPSDLLPGGAVIPPFHGGTSLADDLGIDSLGILEMISAIEHEFGCSIDDGSLNEVSTLQDLYDLYERANTSTGEW